MKAQEERLNAEMKRQAEGGTGISEFDVAKDAPSLTLPRSYGSTSSPQVRRGEKE